MDMVVARLSRAFPVVAASNMSPSPVCAAVNLIKLDLVDVRAHSQAEQHSEEMDAVRCGSGPWNTLAHVAKQETISHSQLFPKPRLLDQLAYIFGPHVLRPVAYIAGKCKAEQQCNSVLETAWVMY